MRAYARSQVEVSPVQGKSVIIDVPSSNGKRMYRMDLTLGRCSCPAWIFMNNKSRSRAVCKHLKAYGFVDINNGG